ncbi:MAG: hypothetical protein JRE14_09055 [Deltaproteobacteria bacterium]|nr:hypothetical protein [Deltaproteobacteria bacterium]
MPRKDYCDRKPYETTGSTAENMGRRWWKRRRRQKCLGGANIHTLLGIKNPPRTINDFITKKYPSLEDICISTGVENLRLLSGASEILSLANLQFAQKVKIIQGLRQLDAEFVILDLGAGTSYNVLDFFLIADRQIVMLTPQPISIQNSYAFVRNAVYRKLSRITSQKPGLLAIIKSAMDPKNELNVRTINELFRVIRRDGGPDTADFLKKELAATSFNSFQKNI